MKLYCDGKIVDSGSDLNRAVVLDKPGRTVMTLVCLGGGKAAFDVDIKSPDVDFSLYGVYLCGGDDNLDIKVRLRHLVGGSSSLQLLRGVAGGYSKVSFDGRIIVLPDSLKTSAMQTNNNIQLSPNAVVKTSPQLEIYADDVQCSHGATAGMLDEDELFYMRSRGLSLSEARRLQIVSFLSPVIQTLSQQTGDEIMSAIPLE